MPSSEFTSSKDEESDESEDDFTDAMTTVKKKCLNVIMLITFL